MPMRDDFASDHPLPLFFSGHADEHEERGSLLLLNASILLLVASLVAMAIILLWGNPVKVFADVTASLTNFRPYSLAPVNRGQQFHQRQQYNQPLTLRPCRRRQATRRPATKLLLLLNPPIRVRQKIEELREHLAEQCQLIESKFQKERDSLVAESEDRKRAIEKLEKNNAEADAKFAELRVQFERETARLDGADMFLEGLLGENKFKAQALRLFAIAIAKIPDDKFTATFGSGAVSEEVATQLKAHATRTA